MLTYYKSAGDDGGAIGDQITDAELNALLPEISSQDRLTGITILRKMWIESDASITCYYSLANEGMFDAYAFKSANENDTIADLTGNEDRYGAMVISSNTTSSVTVEEDPNYLLARAGDELYIAANVVEIDSVTDNGDGTLTIDFSPDIPSADLSGQYCASMMKTVVAASDPWPMWVEVEVAPLSVETGDYNSIDVLTVY